MNIRNTQKCGSTLAVVLTTLAILMVIVGVAFEYTSTINRNTQRTSTMETALAAGDSAIEVLFNSWRTKCRTAPAQVFKTSDFSAVATPSPFPNMSSTNFIKRGTSYDPATDDYDSTYIISNYKIVGVSAEYTAVANAAATPEPALGQVSSNVSSITPTTSASYNYIASADVTLPTSFGSGTQKNVVVKVRRVFSKQQLSPWNWAIFYVDPLEIHPGPLFTVTGWVHTNSDLYTGHSTLTFADKVTYGSDWTIGFMPGDQQHPEAPAAPNYPNNLPPARDQALQPFGLDSSAIFNSSDSNPNNDSYAELIQPPSTGYTDPMAGMRYWDQASIIIQVTDNPSGSTKGWDGVNGHDIVQLYTVNDTTGVKTQITGASPPPYNDLYNMFAASGVITTNQTIQDNRESASVKVASLDISKIVSGGNGNPSYLHPASGFSNNPIVYMYDTSATSSARRAIRVMGGSRIPTNGLTVASNNPVYIQGDFNTGGTGTVVPSNNSSNLNSDGTYKDADNPPSSTVSGYTRAPTSVVADAINVLSSSWVDSKSGTVPAATATTVNTAIVSGNVPTNTYGDGAYSGGAENFPRFLEDWTNKPLTYYGSMIELYKSQQATGEWGKGNVYDPPSREWFFDSNFKMNPPPGSLMLYSYIKGRWYVL